MPDAMIIEIKPEFVIKLDGTALEPKVRQDIQGIRVFQSRRQASSFEIIIQDHESKWSDADLFFDGREIEIELGYVGATVLVFKGEITAWRTELEREGNSSMVIRGMDKSHRLMRGTKTRTFKDKTSPQIAQQIAGDYGLSAVVASGGAQYKFRIQSNETDYKFLQRIAQVDGYEMWVEGDELHFDEPQLSSKEGEAPEYEYGKNIKSFLPNADFRIPVNEFVACAYDNAKMENIAGTAKVGDQIMTLSGTKHGADVAKTAFGEAKRQLTENPPETKDQAERMAKAALTQFGMSFLTGELEVRGDPKIKAGDVVKIVKCGKWFSGPYYVLDANHFYDPGGYETIAFLARDKWGEKSPAEIAEEERDRREAEEEAGAGEEGKLVFQQFVDQDQKPIPKVKYEIIDDGKKKRVSTGTTGDDGIVQTRVSGDGPFKVSAVGVAGVTPNNGVVSGRITMGGEGLPGAGFKLRKNAEDGEEVTADTLKGVTQNEFKEDQWLTDAEGWYRFEDMPGGTYFIDVVESETSGEEDDAPEILDVDLSDKDQLDLEEADDPESARDEDDAPDDDAERVDLRGSFKTGAEILKFVPFRLHKDAADGPLITPENLAPGTTELGFTDGKWSTDGEGKYLFTGMPKAEYFIELVEDVDTSGETTPGGNDSGWQPPPEE